MCLLERMPVVKLILVTVRSLFRNVEGVTNQPRSVSRQNQRDWHDEGFGTRTLSCSCWQVSELDWVSC